MRWPTAGLWALSLVTLTGCPEEFGKNGRINKAVHKDVMAMLRENCSNEELAKFCPQGAELSDECLERCGGK